MAVETCVGCGDKSSPSGYPMVGVTRNDKGVMQDFPVCEACYTNPEHRKYTLKMHFHFKANAAAAVDAAERNILVEGGEESNRKLRENFGKS